MPPADTAAEVANLDDGARQELLDKVVVFANVRECLMAELDKNHKFKNSLREELEGDVRGREKVPMYIHEMAGVRVSRHKPLTEGGMSEDEYREIRTWYRTWLSGEGQLSASWKWAFENSPAEVMERADMGIYDPTDL